MQFQDDLAAGIVLVRPALRSPNYAPGATGWTVNLDGSSEFNDVTIRGTLQSANYAAGSAGWQLLNTGHAEFNDVTVRGTVQSANYAAGSAGWQLLNTGHAELNDVTVRGGTTLGGSAYYYNGTPAAGKLIMSVSSAAGTDPFGNAVVAGLGVYGTSDRVTVKATSGATAVLRADAPSGVSDTPSPGLVLSQATGDAAGGSLTEFDDTFSRGIYLRSPSPVADPTASEGSDYASIRMLGRFHGGDPSIDMEANGPTSTISFNGTQIGPNGEIQVYGGDWSTYTPTISGGGSATYSTRTGWWRRVGSRIEFTAYAVVGVAGSGTAVVQITAPTSIDRTTRQMVPAHTEGFTTGNNGSSSALAFQGGSGNLFDRLRNYSNGSLTGADLLAGGIITVSGSYREG